MIFHFKYDYLLQYLKACRLNTLNKEILLLSKHFNEDQKRQISLLFLTYSQPPFYFSLHFIHINRYDINVDVTKNKNKVILQGF